MGTRSAIGYLQPSGSVRAVYCHWDGYPSNQMPILKKHYNTLEKVKALIKPGSMSSLRTRQTWDTYCGPALKDANGYTRDLEGNMMYVNDREPQPLYHYERGDKDVGPITSGRPLDTWFKEHDCEYLYVFDGKKWITYAERFPDE